MHRGYRLVLFIDQQNGQAVRGPDSHEVSGRVLEQGIALAQHSRPAARGLADIGMDLAERGEFGMAGELR